MRNIIGLPIALVALMLTGCAHLPVPKAGGAVTETLRFYQGEDVADIEGLTFNGETFKAGQGRTFARNDVQAVLFARKGNAGAAAGKDGGADELSPLAQSLLDRGQALAQAYPGVGGVILVDDGGFVYRADGTSTYRYHFAGQVLKEEMQAWAQVSYGFTEGRSRVRVLSARAVNPDGTVHVLPPDALDVGSPSEDMAFFNPNRKVLSGVIPGVEVGSIVEYEYEFENYNPEDPRLFSPGYYFQGREPVVFSRVSVRLPKDVPFNYVTRRFPEGLSDEPAIEDHGGERTYTWVAENMPPIVPEPLMPPEHDVVPMMDSSIFKDFKESFALLAELQKPRMQLTPEIQAKVDEIAAGAATIDDRIAAIYYWVQENTRYISIKGGLGSGMSGHTAAETFENRYGDCTDKAILFGTMCQAIGVTSYPIIVTTNDEGTATTEIPSFGGNHCISEVVVGDRNFYLDSTAQNYRYPYFRADDHGVFAINAIRGDIRQIPVPPPSDNQRKSHLDVTLDANGDVVVRTRNAYTGNIEAGVRGFWKQTREDNREARMADYVNSVSPGAVLEDFTLSDLADLRVPLTMSIDYTIPQHAIRAKDLMYLRLPTLDQDYGEVALESRRYPIVYYTTEEQILEIDLALPRGFRAKWMPPPLEIRTPYVEYDGRYEKADGKILFRQTFRRLERVVPVEEYPAYRDALRAIAEFSKKEIFVMEES